MSILTLLVVLIALGVGLWAITSFIPMDSRIKTILSIVVVVIALLFVLDAFGLLDALRGVRVPHTHARRY